MEIDNQTNDPIDYEQTGSGGQMENCPGGQLAPGQSSGHFVPCGPPPFKVTLESSGTGPDWVVGNFFSQQSTITVQQTAGPRYELILEE